jgi:4-amino-4-deoxy-L-arabinose transferase-like glycosyltransferase
VLAVAGVAGAVALAAGPAAYSVASVGRSLTGSDVRAGPGDTSAVLGDLASGRVVSYLKAQRGSAKYVVATNGRTIAAQIIIQTGLPVVTIGGFIGSDPAPTVSELQKMVARGQLRHVLLVRRGALGAGGSASEAVVAWVKQHGTAVEGLGSGVMLYRVASR